MYQHLDLFSGIGGFSLGLEATGEFETVAFCDYDPFCQKVLRKHWENVPIYGDIKELTYEKLKANGINNIDIITGGYPCQPFSVAGNKKGEQDPRHLWPEYFRLVQECRPTWVIGENVGGHIKLGLDTVLSDLESEGYSARTFSISASSIGANHKRERVWIVANSNDRLSKQSNEEVRTGRNTFDNGNSDMANSNIERLEGSNRSLSSEHERDKRRDSHEHSDEKIMANSSSERLERHRREHELREDSEEGKVSRSSEDVANSDNTGNRTSEYAVNKNRQKIDKRRQEQSQFKSSRQSEDVANSERIRQQGPGKPIGSSNTETNSNGKTSWFNHGSEREEGWWDLEPNVGRVAHGIPNRVDRLKSLGNSLIPHIPYYIGQSIIQTERE
jgi:DNA (cytosine-5)-methyltransferase 1